MNIVAREPLLGFAVFFSKVTRTTLYSLRHPFEVASYTQDIFC